MPMMQAIRGRAGSIIVKVLFALLIVSFGFWGIYTRSDYYQGHNPDSVVAKVGEQSIRVEDVQQVLQPALERLRQQFGGTVDPAQVKQLGILDALLGQLIDRSLLDQETRRLGLDVSDDTIRRAIYDNPAFKGPDGQFDRQRYQALLAMNRTSEDQLVARLRAEIPRNELLQAVTAGASLPRPVLDMLYRYRNEKRVADVVEFPVAAVKDVRTPSDDELQKFYDAHPDLFRAPEFRSFTVASLTPAQVESPAPIPEDKLKAEYEQRKDDLATPETRDIQQILAPSEDKAKEAKSEVTGGKDWMAVAKELGQDPDTVDLGELNRKEIPHELGDVAFELPLDQVSDPVKTPMGWHILRVTKIDPGGTETFEQAKPKIEAAMKLQDAADRLDKIGNQADDALAAGNPLSEVAQKFGLKTATLTSDDGAHDPNGKPVELPVAPEQLLKTVFTTNQGDTSRITDTDDGSIFAIHVDQVTPPQVRPLAEVKDKAVAAWQAEQKRDETAKGAEALAAAVKPGDSLAKAAGDKGLTLLAGVSIGRSPAPGQKIPPSLVAKLFEAKPGDVVTVSEEPGAYVAQLKEVQSPETVSDEAAAGLSAQLARETTVDIAGAYTDALKKRYPVEIQHQVLDRMM